MWRLELSPLVDITARTWVGENEDYPEFPFEPVINGYSETINLSLLQFSNGPGPTNTRLRTSDRTLRMTYNLLMYDPQFSDFLDFFEGVLHAGQDWFSHGDKIVRASSPWSATYRPGERWSVSFEVEQRNG